MRAAVAFSLSFVLAVIVGSLLLPDTPQKTSPKRPAVSATMPALDFLPGLPALVTSPLDDVSKEHEKAWQLVRSGQYRAAEGAYLRILTRHPQDSPAMQA